MDSKSLPNQRLLPARLGVFLAAFLTLGLAAVLLPDLPFDSWDFRNELWGPAHLLTSGQSPYQIKILYPDSLAVWLFPVIGLLFPAGWLSLETASKIWLVWNMAGLVLVGWAASAQARPRPILFALVLGTSFLFPATFSHFELGQISILMVLLLVLLPRFSSDPWLAGLAAALVLTKPQLSFLALPGFVIMLFKMGGLQKAARFLLCLAAWLLLLSIPLFVAAPNWPADFVVALQGNARWIQPSALFFMQTRLGLSAGSLAWGLAVAAAFGVNAWLWLKLPPHQAAAWSLALTCVVAPYVWSWDFVLVLPLFTILLFQSRRLLSRLVLLLGMTGVSAGMLLIRWNAVVSDEFNVWVPLACLLIFIITRVLETRPQRQKFL